MATNQSHDDNDDASSTMKRFKTCDNGGVGPWSDLNHHVLYLVMMKLGVVDYLLFGGVCKSWRSFALSERKMFMSSKPPMPMHVSWRTNAKTCHLKDFDGRKFKTTLDRFLGGTCVGITCGYLIFFRRTTKDFWLVNPITRHQLYFKNFSQKYTAYAYDIRAILVFSRSLSGWVLVVTLRNSTKVWFSKAGTEAWNHLYCRYFFVDLRAFKGIIYTLNFNRLKGNYELYELRLNPYPKLTLIETKNSLNSSGMLNLVSSGDKIYVMDHIFSYRYTFQELDFGEMKWVLREETMTQYAAFLSNWKHVIADKSLFGWSHRQGLLLVHDAEDTLTLMEVEKTSSFDACRCWWYFPHECLNVDLVD